MVAQIVVVCCERREILHVIFDTCKCAFVNDMKPCSMKKLSRHELNTHKNKKGQRWHRITLISGFKRLETKLVSTRIRTAHACPFRIMTYIYNTFHATCSATHSDDPNSARSYNRRACCLHTCTSKARCSNAATKTGMQRICASPYESTASSPVSTANRNHNTLTHGM